MASVTITSSALSPSTKTVLCNNVTVGFKANIFAEPDANGLDKVEVQTQGYENNRISLQGVHVLSGTVASSLMSVADWLTIGKLKYNGSNAPVLNVVYGKPGATSILPDMDGATGGIRVVVDSFNMNISVVDSIDGYRPTMSVNLLETK